VESAGPGCLNSRRISVLTCPRPILHPSAANRPLNIREPAKGSWKNNVRYVRPANRDSYDTDVRYPTHGFRLALGS
jgi:hypothetical protein